MDVRSGQGRIKEVRSSNMRPAALRCSYVILRHIDIHLTQVDIHLTQDYLHDQYDSFYDSFYLEINRNLPLRSNIHSMIDGYNRMYDLNVRNVVGYDPL